MCSLRDLMLGSRSKSSFPIILRFVLKLSTRMIGNYFPIKVKLYLLDFLFHFLADLSISRFLHLLALVGFLLRVNVTLVGSN